MEDIGSGFFKLPDINNIHKSPGDEYKLPTNGLLHSRKFKRLLQLLINSPTDNVYDIMEGHALQDELNKLDPKILADFCRHVLIINKNDIGWQVVDNYLALLAKTTGKATWERPEFIFAEDFNHIFMNMMKWDIPNHLKDLLKKYIEENKILYLSKQKLMDNMSRNYQFWNIKDLFLLLEGLVLIKPTDQNEDFIYQPLVDAIAELILNQIRDRNQEVEKRFVFLTIFSRSLLQLNYERLQEIQELVNRLWVEIENTYQSKDLASYRYVFAIIYAHIGYNYYKQDLDFIHKREFLDRILSSFFSFTDINIGEWLENFLNSNVESLVIALILDGYLQIVHLLDHHAKEMPPSTTLNDIRNRIISIINSLSPMAENYIKSLLGVENLDYHTIRILENNEKVTGERVHILRSIITILSTCFNIKIHYLPDEEIDNKEIERMGKLKEYVDGKSIGELYTKYLQILTNNYKFSDILHEIEYEANKTGSIVTSKTFEEEILRQASSTMDIIKNRDNMFEENIISLLEKLLLFIAEWLLKFKERSQFYQDALMIFSPLISIIYVKIIQSYHQQNKGILSFLVFLVMQHFSLIVKDEIDLVGTMDKEKTLSYLANDFEDMISNWNIQGFTDIELIVDNIKLITASSVPDGSSMGGMLDDELLMGFLERTTDLEKALEIGNKSSNLLNMHEFLYTKPSKGNHPFDRIGLNDNLGFEFPLVRNYLIYNAAISVIPLDVNISQSLKNMDNKGLIVYFFKESGEEFEQSFD